MRLANLFIAELAKNMLAEILDLGFRGKGFIVLMARELEVTVDFAALKLQIQLSCAFIVGG